MYMDEISISVEPMRSIFSLNLFTESVQRERKLRKFSVECLYRNNYDCLSYE